MIAIGWRGLATVLGLAILLCCQANPARERIRAMGREVLQVTPSPGMPRADAEKILAFYFETQISGCGHPGDLKDEGECWTAVPHIGVAGQPHRDAVRLHKASGRITWESGRAFPDLPSLVRSAL